MDESFFQKLARDADKAGLQFLIIGGNAVNAYGYNRTTLDVDLLITENALKDWRSFWESKGYRCVHQAEAFCQLRPADDAKSLPVDLMIVSSDTYRKIEQDQQIIEIGEQQLKAPSPLHLIAMKLHACRNTERAQSGKDLQDILGLITHCEIDANSVDFNEVLERYADEQTKQELRRRINQV